MSSSTSSAISESAATTRSVVVLGATGSIGRQTIDVASSLGVEVAVLVARQPSTDLLALARTCPDAAVIAVGGASDEREWLRGELGENRVSFGTEAMIEAAARPDSIVINGVVGAAGLEPTLSALEAGNRVGLANKESMVAGGPLVRDAVARHGGEVIPVDSEHSALFQLLADVPREHVKHLVLTASGGPFRGRSRSDLADVTPSQALAHPTWDMGSRITIDSATLANKGLEVIEAHALFDVPFDAIDVVVHPQSVVHSLIHLTDGSMLAHLGAADMRIPIQLAITHPDRMPVEGTGFDLTVSDLQFEAPDRETFRALDLAYRAGRDGGTAPAVFNAADEIAVAAFLQERLGFLSIAVVIEQCLDQLPAEPIESIDHVLEVDRQARELAASVIAGSC